MKKTLFFIALMLSFCSQALAGQQYGVSVRTVYTGSNVTTSTSLVIYSSLPKPISSVNIFDNSGYVMELIVTSGASISYIIIPPGGATIPLKLSGGDSVSLIALSGTPTSGTENDINFLY